MKNTLIALENELKKNFKLSRYNLYIPNNDSVVVFNTNTASIVELDSTVLVNEYKEELLRLGIIVSKDTDEIAQLKEEYDSCTSKCKTLNLIVALTLDCQCRCFYCYENHPKTYMDNQTKNSLIDLVKKHTEAGNNVNIVWYGGEPLLDFSSIVELTNVFQDICYANNVVYSAQMISNAYAFNNDIINQFDELGIREIQITLDGLETEHNKRRPVIGDNNSFRRIIYNIKKLDKYSKSVIKVRINVDKKNINEAYRVVDLLKKLHFEHFDITLGMLKTFGCNGCCSTCNDLFSMKEFAVEYLKFRRYLASNGFNRAISKMQPIPKMNSCTLDSPNAYVVDPTGECYKCISHVGRIEHSIGNINTSFDENAHLRYSAFDFDDCKHCKYLPICQGGCLYKKSIEKDECEIWAYITEAIMNDYCSNL